MTLRYGIRPSSYPSLLSTTVRLPEPDSPYRSEADSTDEKHCPSARYDETNGENA